MARKQYEVSEVIRLLSKKKDVSIDTSKKIITITIGEKAEGLGNSSWGKLDFLVHHNNYSLVRVDPDKK